MAEITTPSPSVEGELKGVDAQRIQDEVLGPMSIMSQGFSDSLAQPLKAILPRPYSLGYAGSPRAFFNELMTNDGRGLEECGGRALSATDGTACAYASVRLHALPADFSFLCVGLALYQCTVWIIHDGAQDRRSV